MRSQRKSNSHRLLVVFRHGLIAGFGVDLLYLLGKTGFSLFPVVCDSARDWIGEAAIQSLTRREVLSSSGRSPAWFHTTPSYDLGLIFGGPRTASAAADAAWVGAAAKCDRLFLLSDASGDAGTSAAQAPLPFELRTIPVDPGGFRVFFSELLAEISSYLHHRRFLQKLSFAVFASAPPAFPAGSDDFVRDLATSLRKYGLSQVFPPRSSAPPSQPLTLAIEVYPGPFATSAATDPLPETMEVSFAPQFAPTLPQATLHIRFLHHSLPEDVVKAACTNESFVCTRPPDGHIVCHTPSTTRTIPNLPGRPATDRFAEFLAAHLMDLCLPHP